MTTKARKNSPAGVLSNVHKETLNIIQKPGTRLQKREKSRGPTPTTNEFIPQAIHIDHQMTIGHLGAEIRRTEGWRTKTMVIVNAFLIAGRSKQLGSLENQKHYKGGHLISSDAQ